MPKEFSLTIELDHPPTAVHAALVDEAYWRSRAAESGNATIEIERPDGPGTLAATLTDRTEAAELPAIVRGILRGPLEMRRTDRWQSLDDERATGELDGSAGNLPVVIDGTYRLEPSDNGTRIDASGEVTVSVRVIGGQIEAMVVQMLKSVLDKDRAALSAWIDGS